MSKIKEIQDNTMATIRGIKKTWAVIVGLAEAFAWGIALSVLGYIIYRVLMGDMTLDTTRFSFVVFAFASLSIRMLLELGRYFREIGRVESGTYKAQGRS